MSDINMHRQLHLEHVTLSWIRPEVLRNSNSASPDAKMLVLKASRLKGGPLLRIVPHKYASKREVCG
jgi:hypothetical protein